MSLEANVIAKFTSATSPFETLPTESGSSASKVEPKGPLAAANMNIRMLRTRQPERPKPSGVPDGGPSNVPPTQSDKFSASLDKTIASAVAGSGALKNRKSGKSDIPLLEGYPTLKYVAGHAEPDAVALLSGGSCSATVLEVEEKIIELLEESKKKKASLKVSKLNSDRVQKALVAQLYEYKKLLAKTGRNGRWTGFLKLHGLSRATADRWVERYKQSLETGEERVKRLNEALSGPTKTAVTEAVKKLTPKLIHLLTTLESVNQFIRELAVALQTPGSPA